MRHIGTGDGAFHSPVFEHLRAAQNGYAECREIRAAGGMNMTDGLGIDFAKAFGDHILWVGALLLLAKLF
jgi:hypothetical protein